MTIFEALFLGTAFGYVLRPVVEVFTDASARAICDVIRGVRSSA